MSEVTSTSKSLHYYQNKLDLSMEHKGEKITEFAEEPKVNPLNKRSFQTSEQVPDKKPKLSPSPLMDLPNEIWMKILTFLPTNDILKNFNLTCKYFHSLATNPCVIESLQLELENAKESSHYQEIVKLLNRSKTLNKLSINGHGRVNHILAHGLKLNNLKTLEVSTNNYYEATLSKKNAEYIKNSKIESLKLNDITLDKYAMQKIGAVKTLKSIRISIRGLCNSVPCLIDGYCLKGNSSISELFKTFIDAKIDVEDLAIAVRYDLDEIYPSVFIKFLEERGESLKKLKIRCNISYTTMKDDRKEEKFTMKWNATSNLEELFYDDFGSQNGNCPIAFGLEMPKLTKLALQTMDGNVLKIFGTTNFPVLERLYLDKKYGDEFDSQESIFNIFVSCPNLKSVKLRDFDVSDLQSIESWNLFLCKIYKIFNVYIDVNDGHSSFTTKSFENYLKKTDLGLFEKYTKIKNDYLDWKKELPSDEWWCW